MAPTGMEAAARLIDRAAGRPLTFTPAFTPIETSDAPPCMAVDGSHAVLVDNGATWIVAVRAASWAWPGGTHQEVPVRIEAALPAEAQDRIDAAHLAHGLQAPTVRSAEAFAEAWRTLAEHEALLGAIDALPVGGLLLVDGALEGLPGHAAPSIARVLEKAARLGVHVAGVAKRSRLDDAGLPLVPTLARRGPRGPWSVPVPGQAGVFVARLHAQASHAFRVDVTGPEVLGMLLPLSRDAVYVGYPYPLAAVHNTVAINQAMARQLRERLSQEVRRFGGAGLDLLADFHDVLDRNAPR